MLPSNWIISPRVRLNSKKTLSYHHLVVKLPELLRPSLPSSKHPEVLDGFDGFDGSSVAVCEGRLLKCCKKPPRDRWKKHSDERMPSKFYLAKSFEGQR